VQVVPEVTSTPCKTDSPDELELAYPEIFPVCVTTHAMSAKRNVQINQIFHFMILLWPKVM